MPAAGTRSRKLVIIEVAMVTLALVVIATLLYRAFFVVQVPKTDEVLRLPDAQSLKALQVFPLDDPWNTDISNEPVDPNSSALIASIGTDKPLHPDFGTQYRGAPLGIPFTLVAGDQVKVPVSFRIAGESDPGPYPIPPDAAIEGGSTADGDRHVIVLDKTHSILYELYAAFPEEGGQRWRAGGGAIFDLKKNSVQRPLGWTSADAAGLPIFPGLVRYDQ
ncbi:MAG TPA: hypothetical protein VFN20_05580, partial [Candidatus Acidoferrum sp.]|nr:hypothetical protein [Candidatus Acidoferrum sp.]